MEQVDVQAKHTFKNGNSVSVVGGELLNGNGVDTWEIGIIDEKNDVMETIDFAEDQETIDLIKPILKKIDELQNEIEEQYD